MPEIKLICFDLDGVLADACELHKVALNRALTENGIPAISEFDHLKTYNGLPTMEKLKKLGIPLDKALEVNRLKQEITSALIGNTIAYDYSKYSMCLDLKDKKLKLACVSNCSEDTGVKMLNRVGIYAQMDMCVWNKDCKPKPCSEGYINAMVSMRSLPSETIIVEDSPHGILAARNTGAKVIEVKNATEVNYSLFKDYL